MPTLIGGYFFKLASNSPTIFTTGPASQELYAPTSRADIINRSKMTPQRTLTPTEVPLPLLEPI